ncbi:MAG: hypothetical protein P1U34_01070 [Coxiellaceae bacterium]|nr:hypothetical protein [Coxiellaceae bacterium]
MPGRLRPKECAYSVAGFASPNYRGHNDHLIPQALQQLPAGQSTGFYVASYLSQQGFKRIISFEEQLDPCFKLAIEANGMSYEHMPMAGRHCHNNLAIHTPDVLDDFYKRIVSYQAPVAIHCMGGMGRTGTHLAALILRRKLEGLISQPDVDWQQLRSDSENKPASVIPSDFITTYCKGVCSQTPIIPCTRLVAEVISDLRALEAASGVTAHFGVETAVQIQSLCDYQKYLLNHFQ